MNKKDIVSPVYYDVNDFPFLTYEQLAVLRLEVAERLAKQMSDEERFKYISDHIFHSLPLEHIELQGTLIRAGAGDLLDQILKEILGEDYKVTAKKKLLRLGEKMEIHLYSA